MPLPERTGDERENESSPTQDDLIQQYLKELDDTVGDRLADIVDQTQGLLLSATINVDNLMNLVAETIVANTMLYLHLCKFRDGYGNEV
jgi:hypothetical protein